LIVLNIMAISDLYDIESLMKTYRQTLKVLV